MDEEQTAGAAGRLSVLDEIRLLQNKIDGLKEQRKAETKKQFRLPWNLTFGARGKQKKGRVLVLRLKPNKYAGMEWISVTDGTVKLMPNETHHLSEFNLLFNLFGKWPLLVLPEWSFNPISPDCAPDNSAESIKVAIKLSEKAALEMKDKKGGFKGMTVIWIIAALVGAFYVLKTYVLN